MAQKTDPSADLAWLLDDLVKRVNEAHHAIVLSADGLLMASSQEFEHEDAEHLAAVAAGFQSLAKGVGRRFGGGPVRQTVVEMTTGLPLGDRRGRRRLPGGPSSDADADIGQIAYEMALLVKRGRPPPGAAARTDRPAMTRGRRDLGGGEREQRALSLPGGLPPRSTRNGPRHTGSTTTRGRSSARTP